MGYEHEMDEIRREQGLPPVKSDSEFLLWLAEIIGMLDSDVEKRLRAIAARLKCS